MVTVNNIPPIIFDALTALAGALDSAVYPPLNIYNITVQCITLSIRENVISESLKGQVNLLFKATSALKKHRISINKM